MTAMTAWLPFFRIGAMVLWLCVALYMSPAAYSVTTGRRLRANDPFRFAIFLVALLLVGFGLRGQFAPDSASVLLGLHVLSGAVALYAINLARASGRGNHVD